MSSVLARKLGQAQEQLQRGNVAGAQLLCQEVLARAPLNPDALCLLAVTYLMSGHANQAIVPLQQVLAAQPRHGAALENLGLAHLMIGEFSEAARALGTAAAIPSAPASVFMRLGLALLNQGSHAEAVNALQRALELDPHNPDIHLNLGQAAHHAADPAQARQHFEAALQLDPSHLDAMFNLGVVCLEEQNMDEAQSWFERVLAQAPRHTDAAVNLAIVLEKQQRLDEAIATLRRAVTSDPTHARARNNLAQTLTLQGQLEPAHAEYLAALHLAPQLMEAREGLASVCIALGRFQEGITHLRMLLQVDSPRPAILVALSDALFEIGELDEAEATAKRAMALDATMTAPYSTLADIHSVRGELDLTVATLQSGVAQTGAIHLLGNLVYQLRRLCDWKKWHDAWHRLSAALPDTRELVSPFSLLCEPLTAVQQLAYARRWCDRYIVNDHGGESRAVPRGERGARIRIGYISSDFYDHATAYLLAEVLEMHDRRQFEIFAYSYGPEDNSAMRARLRAACEHFIDIARDPDDIAARHVQNDDLDVLIDLKGHTMGARTALLARRPCPVQVSWIGYPGTMGASFIDFLIADSFIIPPAQESAYAERILRLPHCYQPNDRKRAVASPRSRTEYGLPDAGFVFCCFNQAYKITPEVFTVWMRLLLRTPGSVLWLLEDNRWAISNLRAAAQAHDVDPSHLVFAPKLPLAQHLARYRIADLALDTYPYTSHTTASDALWGGCPLIALCGETFAARVSGSILTAGGLPELITYSLEDYERLALRVASDQLHCDALRARLTNNQFNVPLFDSQAFTNNLENIYRTLVG